MQLESIYVYTLLPTGKYAWSAFYNTTYETLVQPGVLVKVYVSPLGLDYY